MSLLVHDARLVSPAGPFPPRGEALARLETHERGWVLTEGAAIAAIGEGDAPNADEAPGARRIDADGRVLLPGFVDCHTHACWAGDRLAEWEMKLRGASYLELLEAGGGILSTVRAVREASRDDLVRGLLGRLDVMAREGTTSVEVKSGYGLTTGDELKMLEAIVAAGEQHPLTVVPTACIGHAIDDQAEGGARAFVRRTIEETLPAVSEAHPGIAVDAYCESAAWSLDDCALLFEEAARRGHPIRVHSDQFKELGMTRWAVEHGALSVDHLEATSAAELERLGASDTFGVVLPCSGFHVDGRYADARTLIDAGGRLALGTNFNPGSSPCPAMALAIALAVRHAGLLPAEAIVAATAGGAGLLGLTDRGRLAAGARADLVLLRHRDERALAFEVGASAVDFVVAGGEVVSPR